MSIFALKKIEAINGPLSFNMLCIKGKCQFQEFEEELKKIGTYTNELGSIYSYFENISDGKSLPNKKFREISPRKDKDKEYEFKTKNLRVYAIKKHNGQIIVFGGYKNTQKRDITKFRSIKKRYLSSLNPTKNEKRRITKK